MGMNKQIGNMYPFVTHTWNPIRGKCPHDCVYCSIKGIAKRFDKPQGKMRLVEKELRTDLGNKNYIFVGSSTDMFADSVPKEWIQRVINYCNQFSNKYLFQTKNPKRFLEFIFPNSVLGITLETNRNYGKISKAPSPIERAAVFSKIKGEKMVSVEPVLDFDVEEMVSIIKKIGPEFVSIGADSKRHELNEPSKEKILKLISALDEFTTVIEKDNLRRLTKEVVK